MSGSPEDRAELRAAIQRLAALRADQGLTQQAAAARMGISQPTLSEIEGGKTGARVSAVQRYAGAVGARLRFELDFPEVDDER